MAEVYMSKEVAVAPDVLWEKIGDFLGFDRWFPGIPQMEADDDGKVRRIGTGDNAVVEELVGTGERSYSYRIVQGPLPVKEYVSTLSVCPSGDGSLVEWKSTFEPNGVPEEQAVMIVQGIYTAGLANL
jgi:Polyketide cyclase / dehydrase and lipid transport